MELIIKEVKLFQSVKGNEIIIKFASNLKRVMNKTKITFLLLIVLCVTNIKGELKYGNVNDKDQIESLIRHGAAGNSFGERVLLAAKGMEGLPEGPVSDNDSIGTIFLKTDSLDRMEFINLALAIGMTAELQNPSLKEFEENYEKVSRRKGKDEGFASQFFYGADWIGDNIYRGILKEMTEYIESGNYKTKTLDRMSHNRDKYPALADSDVYDKVKIIEMGFRSHRIPHLKKQSAANKQILENMQSGDIIMMLVPDNDYDLYDIGVVEMINGQPHLIHLSHQNGKVTVDPYPLQRLFKLEGQYFYGFRWLRPNE